MALGRDEHRALSGGAPGLQRVEQRLDRGGWVEAGRKRRDRSAGETAAKIRVDDISEFAALLVRLAHERVAARE